MKVTYLFNSGFLVELKQHLLLFDYYQGSIPKLDINKPLYVFVSHSHYDHYNEAIYKINHPNITYIIDEFINNRGLKVKPHQTYHVNDLTITTLLSTDLGVAFVIKVANKYLYHGGDLNWWHWEGEPDEDNNYQEITFKQEINLIKNINFDLMFTALDPRLKKATHWAMNYILENVTTRYMIPMHFTSDKQAMQKTLRQPPLNHYQNIIAIDQEGETLIL